MIAPSSLPEFLSSLQQSLQDACFVKLALSQYRGAEEELKRIDIRKIIVKREEKLSFTFHYKTRDIVKNHAFSDSVQLVGELLEQGFRSAILFTTEFDLHFEVGAGLKKTAATQKEVPSATHNREKQRLIAPEGKSYLCDLRITDDAGNVFKNAQDKFRQINKYVEILSGLLKNLPPCDELRIVDMGSGKGYLTFALYDYVVHTLGRKAAVTGVEYRPDMVDLCNHIARDAGFEGLHFVADTIEHFDCRGAHVVIALHACDTATDDAIAKAILAEAELVVVAPCCHKQIRREMEAHKAKNDLGFLTKHGTLMERQAEMVTDAMRAQIMEYAGYQTKLFEFISDAHTPKNVMIIGTRLPAGTAKNSAMHTAIQAAKSYFGIGYHHLEHRLEQAQRNNKQ